MDANDGTTPLAPSRPLYELADHTPAAPQEMILELVDFPFSNDESAGYYDQLRIRTALPEYRQAANRTAVIVGEGSLMAALPMIEEDTIVLVDRSEDMCAYMQRYVDALKEAENFDEWGEMMKMKDGDKVAAGADNAVGRIRGQVLYWLDEGYGHPVEDDELFALARAAAERKAIIPWRADLTDGDDMRYLGDVLRAHDAQVTMLNLTNALGSSDSYLKDAPERAETLSALPVTPHAPVLATSFLPTNHHSPRATAVGPFFGLKNLGEQGGTSLDHLRRRNETEASLQYMGGMTLLRGLVGLFETDGAADKPDINIVSLGPDGARMVSLDLGELPPDLREAIRRQQPGF